MKHEEIRKKFLDFFEKRGHAVVSSSSLVPSDDPSVLLTTAGMQQFKPYYVGKKDAMADFGSQNTTSIQKCFRTSDIDEVGDETHLTFFEMFGNFSFGYKHDLLRSLNNGYFKKEAIEYAHQFITNIMGLEIDFVTVFEGDDDVPYDKESFEIWKILGVAENKIRKEGREDNFWGPTGNEGPCGPTTEIYVNGVEIWNIVFNEYYCSADKNLKPLKNKGVDTGMGLERLIVMKQKVRNIFETDLFKPIMDILDEVKDERIKRIIADHLRGSMFLIEDGVRPSNVGEGYILRRLLRKIIKYEKTLNLDDDFYGKILKILNKKDDVLKVIFEERKKFVKTLDQGLKEFNKLSGKNISGSEAFVLFSTYGFPLEMTEELAEEKRIKVDRDEFDREFEKHQKISRVGAEQKFKGGLAGTGTNEAQLHTATHLLQEALRKVLGKHISQKGSNVTPARLRFDFSHPQKLTEEEKTRIEDLVNAKIKEDLPITFKKMSLDEAKKIGALGVFENKYDEHVKVYKMGNFSVEICGGPHAKSTGELGRFRIKKEEAVAFGVRRIKAVLE